MITYRLLGPLDAMRAGQPIDLGGPKQRLVLAALLLESGRVVSTDRLVQALWGDAPTPSAIGSLQVYISNLRRALRDEDVAVSPIVRRNPGYLMDVAPDDLDTARFVALAGQAQQAVSLGDWSAAVETARHGLALWRGPLLVEYADEDWVRLAAVGFQERRVECQQDLVTGLLGSGQVNPAVASARELHSQNPLSEKATWLFMLALHRAGRSGDALDVYRAHSRALDDELGLDVATALRDLQGAILRQEPSLERWPADPAQAPAPAAVSASAPPALGDLRAEDSGSLIVGRTRELETMRDVLLDARAGLGWVVLSGEAGIGKSRLAEEGLRRWQARGGQVLRTGCPDDDVPPWWPIRQLLRQLGDDDESVLLPPDGEDVDAARYIVYDRLLTVLENATVDNPLLLLVDDVHWADRMSLSFLTHLAETQPQLDLAVVVTARDGVANEGLSRLFTAIARLPGGRSIALPPMSAEEVTTLANLVSGEELSHSDAAHLAQRTGGNPFFVCEYARLPAEERRTGQVPIAVRSVLGRRLAGLDPEVLSLLRIAALCGGRLDVDLLAAVARSTRDDLADLLDDAADEHIIAPAPGSNEYTFAHALLRDEVVAGLSPMRQQRLHLRIADSIPSEGDSAQLVARASHLLAALPLADAAEAFRACCDTARDAERGGQWDAAAHWWKTALQPLDTLPQSRREHREDIVIAWAASLARAGRGATTLRVVDEGLLDEVRAGRLSAAGRLAAVPLRSSGAWPWVAPEADPGPLVQHLADIEPSVRSDPAAHVRVLSSLACGMTYDPAGTAPDRLSREARAVAERLGDHDVLADAILGRALTFAGIAARATESIELLAELEALPHALAEIDDVLRHSLLVMALMTLGRPDEAEAHLRLGAYGADSLRLPVARTQLRWAEATLALWRGDLPRARTIMEHAAQLHEDTELYHAGTFDAARTCLHWAQGTLASVPDLHPDLHQLSWAAAVVAAARDEPGCDELLATEVRREAPDRWVTHGTLTAVAHAVVDRELVDLAAPLVAKLQPYTSRIAIIGHVGVVGPVDLALSRLNLLLGDLDAADRHQEAAYDLAVRGRGEGTRLGCMVLAQRIAMERGRPADLAALQLAAQQADQLGFRTIARGAQALLAATSAHF